MISVCYAIQAHTLRSLGDKSASSALEVSSLQILASLVVKPVLLGHISRTQVITHVFNASWAPSPA